MKLAFVFAAIIDSTRSTALRGEMPISPARRPTNRVVDGRRLNSMVSYRAALRKKAQMVILADADGVSRG
jgi:uncharacterized ParB-like nuclease family protein